jgi:membrane protease YdiL (CAAX protease family)
MSARPVRREASRAAWVPAALGVGALLLRSSILSAAPWTRAALLVAVFGAILAACLLVPIPAGRARARPAPVFAVGLAAVGTAALVAGPVVAAPMGPWALPLSLLAAVAEEALFRRVVYAWLERLGPGWAVLGSAGLFAIVHAPLYGLAALPVDLGAGLLLSWQRWASGSWTVPAATHAAANLVAVVLR